MSGIRQSFIFAGESEFGKGIGSGLSWVAPPAGSYFSSTHARQATRVQSMGTKTWDAFAYGALQGSWDWTFMLDYNYLEPLRLVFEDYNISSTTHTFKKENNRRVPSFTVRRVVLNEMAGGPTGSDEIVEVYGCVCTSFTMSRSAGSSQYQVQMSGFYADEKMIKGSIGETDYEAPTVNLVEYACLLAGGKTDGDYIANTESISLAVDNSAEAIYNTCSPFATQYAEGLSTYTFSTSCYSNDPAKYKQRVYSGGKTNTALAPMSKGLAPLDEIHLLSFDLAARDKGGSITTAYEDSSHSVDIDITDCVIRSLPWQKGDGSKLMDTISSAQCKMVEIKIKTDNPTGKKATFDIYDSTYERHTVTPVEPKTEQTGGEGNGQLEENSDN